MGQKQKTELCIANVTLGGARKPPGPKLLLTLIYDSHSSENDLTITTYSAIPPLGATISPYLRICIHKLPNVVEEEHIEHHYGTHKL